jgi:hypothetical protein
MKDGERSKRESASPLLQKERTFCLIEMNKERAGEQQEFRGLLLPIMFWLNQSESEQKEDQIPAACDARKSIKSIQYTGLCHKLQPF